MISATPQEQAQSPEAPCLISASVSGGGRVGKVARTGLGEAAVQALQTFGSGLRRRSPSLPTLLLAFPVGLAFFALSDLFKVEVPGWALVVSSLLVVYAAMVLLRLVSEPPPREARVCVTPDVVRIEMHGRPPLDLPLIAVMDWGGDPEVDFAYGRSAGILLRLGSGALVRVRTTPQEADALASALSAGLGRAQAARSVLTRGARTIQEWKSALVAATQEHAYRGARPPLGPELLERILSHEDMAEELRVGAALALSAAGEANGRQRVRVAAAQSESRKLRVALSLISEEAAADEALEEAISQSAPRRISA